jgi:2-keto-3-deoxy-L-rhamnonate aldolase RhmA
MRKNRLKELWRENQTAFGVWASLGSPAVVEAMAGMKVDWILLDAEHGICSYEDSFSLLQAMNGSQATSLVRVPSCDQVPIRRVLDLGAEGVLVPTIRTPEEVQAVVSFCRYPPDGVRGVGPNRASRYFLDYLDYCENANAEIAVIVQIETLEAIDNLDDILGVPGLDAVFIGPADLSSALGTFPDANAPVVQEAIDRVLNSANERGIPVGYYCNTGREAEARAKQGFRMLNVGNDTGFITISLHRALKEARGES